MAVLNSIELEGVSADSWNAAALEALREAAKTLRQIRRLHVLRTSAILGEDGTTEYHTHVRLFFEVEAR